ncbi:MAG: UvrD-helicase domain-containing protein [Hyphomicrobiales bacterium]
MKIIADFHVHSKYSRATAKDLDLENLYIAAQMKGVQVVGTGDFSHPAWFAEIGAKLDPAEPGLFRLKKETEQALDARVPASCRGIVRFVLATEISNIYKKDGKTRKNHNLVLAPDLEVVRRLNRKLEKIGNIQSDGRPILGLDARDLLEVVLETSSDAFLVPAHIWTPWFSVLGSKSGFDSLAGCFGDLTAHVFAAETGLSSDPEMNWRVSFLDGVTLISNSDAHSPANLGREANIFDTDLCFSAMRDALKSGGHRHFSGTIEFYPEEGKYHLDGHRSCRVCWEPKETCTHQGLCPECGKPVTIGVLNRVEELADRPAGQRPERAHPYHNLIPLTDILSEILQAGPKTQKVSQAYRMAIETLGPELGILQQMDLEQIERARIPLLGEAVKRMREKQVDISPGFDGEYGRVRIFKAGERSQIRGQKFLFAIPDDTRPARAAINLPLSTPKPLEMPKAGCESSPADFRATLGQLNEEQRRSLEYGGSRLLIVAGPGTGKTHTLTCRIAHQISESGVPADRVLAVTFTHKAADEMRSRIKALLGERQPLPFIGTFHGLCSHLLRESNPELQAGIIDEDEQVDLIKEAAALTAQREGVVPLKAPALLARIMRAKQNLLSPEDLSGLTGNSPEEQAVVAVYHSYRQLLEIQRLSDYEDLIFKVARRLEADPEFCRSCRNRFRHVYVDEYQDLNHGQYRIIRKLVPTGSTESSLCVIGDPDQSIYAFRGSDSSYFQRFLEDYPDAAVLQLTRNYRSTDTILSASFQVINRDGAKRSRTYSSIDGVKTVTILELANERAEAEAMARAIEGLVGGTGYHSVDTGRVQEALPPHAWSYADFAVLARTGEQLRIIAEGFEACGIPFQAVSRRQTFAEKGVAELLSFLRVLSGCGRYGDFDKIAAVLAPNLGRRIIAIFRDWCLKSRLCLQDGLSSVARFPIPGLSRNQQLQLTELVGRLSAMAQQTATLTAQESLMQIASYPALAALFGEEKPREALNGLASLLAGSDANDKGVINRCALYTDIDVYHPRAEKAALMTMHAAKGLEFSVVFIPGCEDELIPYRRPADGASTDINEERRLFYVAMTRAKERLYLTLARRRRMFGKTADRTISPFVKDIESRLLMDESPRAKLRKKKPDQLPLF